MALGDAYATLTELKEQFRITDTVDDPILSEALLTASREVDRHCDRQFNKTTVATTRVFRPGLHALAVVDDFHTTTDLVIKTDISGTGAFSTTWTTNDYELEPLNGVVDGELGWPFYRIRAVGYHFFPATNKRAGLQVTAQWGWAEVPAPVKRAAMVIASETFKIKDAPFGVAGYAEYGPVRVKNSPIAMRMLAPYRRHAVRIG